MNSKTSSYKKAIRRLAHIIVFQLELEDDEFEKQLIDSICHINHGLDMGELEEELNGKQLTMDSFRDGGKSALFLSNVLYSSEKDQFIAIAKTAILVYLDFLEKEQEVRDSLVYDFFTSKSLARAKKSYEFIIRKNAEIDAEIDAAKIAKTEVEPPSLASKKKFRETLQSLE